MVELIMHSFLQGGLCMKKAIAILSVILVANIPALADPIPGSLSYILLSSPGNRDNSINDNSINIEDSSPVLSYYEFKHPMNDRLTDEAWRALLASPEKPDRPKWYTSLIRQSNNFTTKTR